LLSEKRVVLAVFARIARRTNRPPAIDQLFVVVENAVVAVLGNLVVIVETTHAEEDDQGCEKNLSQARA
jgi:hypothetical protein